MKTINPNHLSSIHGANAYVWHYSAIGVNAAAIAIGLEALRVHGGSYGKPFSAAIALYLTVPDSFNELYKLTEITKKN